MQQRVRLRSLAWLRVMGSALLILAVLAAGLAAPANAQAQDAGDPLHAARAAEVTSLWRLAVAAPDAT